MEDAEREAVTAGIGTQNQLTLERTTFNLTDPGMENPVLVEVFLNRITADDYLSTSVSQGINIILRQRIIRNDVMDLIHSQYFINKRSYRKFAGVRQYIAFFSGAAYSGLCSRVKIHRTGSHFNIDRICPTVRFVDLQIFKKVFTSYTLRCRPGRRAG